MRIFSVLSSLLLASSGLFAANNVSSQLLNLAPGTARVVAGIDVTQARNSPFGQYLLNQMNNTAAADPGFQEFIQQTGFDPRSDVQQLIMLSDGKNQPNFGIIALATFDKEKMQAAATKFGATLSNYQGVDLILANKQHGNVSQNGGPGALAFLESGVIVAGNLDTVERIIAGRAQPSSLDPALLSQVETISGANDAWVVSIVPLSEYVGSKTPANANDLGNSKVFQSILQTSAGVQFGSQVNVSGDALTKSSQDATSVSDVLRFLAGMAQMQKTPDPNAAILAKALTNLVLTTKGSDVHLALTFAEQDLEHLAQSHSHGARHNELLIH